MPSGLLTIVTEYNEEDQNSGLLIEDALFYLYFMLVTLSSA